MKLKKILAIMMAAAMAAAMAACGGNSGSSSDKGSDTGTEESASSGSSQSSGQTYTIGICQQMEHDALDQATQGFKDACTELFGEGNVEFDEQNAQGEQAMCSTIINKFCIFRCGSDPGKRYSASADSGPGYSGLSRSWEPLLPTMPQLWESMTGQELPE